MPLNLRKGENSVPLRWILVSLGVFLSAYVFSQSAEKAVWYGCKLGDSGMSNVSENISTLTINLVGEQASRFNSFPLSVSVIWHSNISNSRAFSVGEYIARSARDSLVENDGLIGFESYEEPQENGFARYYVKRDYPRVLVTVPAEILPMMRIYRDLPPRFELDYFIAKTDLSHMAEIDQVIDRRLQSVCAGAD